MAALIAGFRLSYSVYDTAKSRILKIMNLQVFHSSGRGGLPLFQERCSPEKLQNLLPVRVRFLSSQPEEGSGGKRRSGLYLQSSPNCKGESGAVCMDSSCADLHLHGTTDLTGLLSAAASSSSGTREFLPIKWSRPTPRTRRHGPFFCAFCIEGHG